MTRPDAEWVAEALTKSGLRAEIVGSLMTKKQSRHDIDITVQIIEDRDYQTYWYALEKLGFRYDRTDPPPSGEIWIGRSRDGSSVVLDMHPVTSRPEQHLSP
ncbi:MAG TPA: hypothetical protein VGJ57_00410 [Nitrospirales bacterium]|jgi:hypothetical protein